MPSADDITKTVHRYLELVAEGRTDDIADLYTDDATVEDPAGGEVHIGREAIRGFYAGVLGAKTETEVVTLRALGHEAAFLWRLTVDLGEGAKMRIEIISVMSFDDDANITSMKAYWGPDNITQL
ncbi:MAG: steroid Delta-isomerase [Mycobacterium sp.]|jgi:steroid delta-isomerase|nr:steroid Delta-isomerase [Mycobacterium sp.]